MKKYELFWVVLIVVAKALLTNCVVLFQTFLLLLLERTVVDYL